MSRRTIGWLGATAIALAMSGSGLAGREQDPREVFERARLLAEGGRKLADAVAMYEQVVATAGGDRALAAAAQLQIGVVYERLGRPEARAAFAKVADRFGEQPSAAAARARIAALTARRMQSDAPRRLVSSQSFEMTSVSADGRIAAGFDTPPGAMSSIAVCDLTTGQVTVVVAAVAGLQFTAPDISPDGSQIAYGSGTAGPPPRTVELRVVAAAAGATPRVLFSAQGAPTILPSAWSPDGKFVLTGRGSGSGVPGGGLVGTQYAWVNVATGEMRVIRTFESWRVPLETAVSPDGAWIAYSAFPRPSTAPPVPDKYIYVHDADGRNESPAVTMAGMNRFPVWSPDGSQLVFTNERGGARTLYAIAMQNGRPAGEPVRLLDDIEAPALVTPSGSLIFTRGSGGGQFTFVGDRDAAGTKVIRAFDGSNAALSPDGQTVAFLRVTSRTSATAELTTRAVETGVERRYPGVSPNTAVPLQWLPNGTGLIVYAAGVGGAAGKFYRLQLESGTYQPLFDKDTDEFVRTPTSAISPDGKTLYLGIRPKSATGGWTGIGAVELSSGTMRTLAAFPGDGIRPVGPVGPTFAVSPDGSTLAMLWVAQQRPVIQTRVALLSTSSGQFTELGGPYGAGLVPAWSADGQFVLHGYRSEPGAWRLMQIPRGGGEATFAGLDLSALRSDIALPPMAAATASAPWFSLSRDGSRISFNVPTLRSHEIWARDNVLRK